MNLRVIDGEGCQVDAPQLSVLNISPIVSTDPAWSRLLRIAREEGCDCAPTHLAIVVSDAGARWFFLCGHAPECNWEGNPA